MARMEYVVGWVPLDRVLLTGPGSSLKKVAQKFADACDAWAAKGYRLVNVQPERWGESGYYLFFEREATS